MCWRAHAECRSGEARRSRALFCVRAIRAPSEGLREPKEKCTQQESNLPPGHMGQAVKPHAVAKGALGAGGKEAVKRPRSGKNDGPKVDQAQNEI